MFGFRYVKIFKAAQQDTHSVDRAHMRLYPVFFFPHRVLFANWSSVHLCSFELYVKTRTTGLWRTCPVETPACLLTYLTDEILMQEDQRRTFCLLSQMISWVCVLNHAGQQSLYKTVCRFSNMLVQPQGLTFLSFHIFQ